MAIVKVDPNLSARVQFLEMAARVSLTRHPDANVTLGTPIRVNQTDPADTMIAVNTQSKHTRRQRMVRYRRADLHKAFLFQQIQLDVASDATPEQIVLAINALGFTQILLTEVTLSAPAPSDNPQWNQITVTARPESLLYVESFKIHIPSGNVSGGEAFLKVNLRSNQDVYLIRADGTRGTLRQVNQGELAHPRDLTGCTFLTPIYGRFDKVLYLVDAEGRPLPVDQQPETYSYALDRYNQPQMISKTEVLAALQMYEDYGLPPPEWFVPGCCLLSVGIDQVAPRDAKVRLWVAGRDDIAAVEYGWRLPRFTARCTMTELVSRNMFYRLPANTPCQGELRATFPLLIESYPDDPSYFIDQGQIDETSGFTGGVLNLVDTCNAWNTPNFAGDSFDIVATGEIDWCEDIPEWVGTPFEHSSRYFTMQWPCLSPEKIADVANMSVDPNSLQPSNFSTSPSFPGSTDYLAAWTVSYFPDRIIDLDVRVHPTADLPLAN